SRIVHVDGERTHLSMVVASETSAEPRLDDERPAGRASREARRGDRSGASKGSGSLLPVPSALTVAPSPVAVPVRRATGGLARGPGSGRGEGLLLLPFLLLGLLRLRTGARLCRRLRRGGRRRRGRRLALLLARLRRLRLRRRRRRRTRLLLGLLRLR